jgi:polysaccharide biosynthesis PFTS motif protein
MRGYRVLKQSGRIDLIAKVKEALTQQGISLSAKDFSACLMGAGFSHGEIVVRQYLLIRIGGLGLNQALLHALGKNGGKVIFPLPKEWQVTISKYGFDVANIRSSLLWYLYILGACLYGALQIAKVIFSGFKSLFQESSPPKNHVYFANLSSGNLPHGIHGQKSYDIVSWYLQWSGRAQSIEAVHHSVPNVPNKLMDGVNLVFQPQALPALIGLKAVARYTAWGVMACFIALMDCLRGRWWHALLLNQAALSAQVRLLPKTSLAYEYLFNNSGWIYRPLWTYDAEKVGSKIIFYFYSTNCENFKTSETEASIPYGWQAMSWPNYLVWDKRQADFVKMSVGNEHEISIVGSIWFQSGAVEVSILGDVGVAVFDITPHRKCRYITLGLDNEFYTPVVANSFMQLVSNAILQQGLVMNWKKKRSIGRTAHPFYRRLADQLVKSNHVRLIDPDISGVLVIEKSTAVISMPFTSTALIAREMGKPSVYFDPTGLLQNDDGAAHGIPVLSNQTDLEAWLSDLISQ